MNKRHHHLVRFYSALSVLREKIGGARQLSACNGKLHWPQKGIYFFFEQGEYRSHTGDGLRIVRVGTHALKSGSKAKLWTRLSQHKGSTRSGGGNHRGSIFRLIIGTSLIRKDSIIVPTWGKGSSADLHTRDQERPHEIKVSQIIGDMPFLWLGVEDEAGPESLRGYVERNAIALLSNYDRQAIDPPSNQWLGRYCDREKVRMSGLWNSNHVSDSYDPNFISVFESLIAKTEDLS